MYTLNLDRETLEKYLKILPISYYLGCNVSVGITNDDASYCDSRDNHIMISLPQLNSIQFKNKPNDDEIEKNIRCMLYHEVSHAILTPLTRLTIDHTIFNIFEDQRIETLLDCYYRDVDFKDFVIRINDFNPDTPPVNYLNYFYRVVRFKCGEESLVKRVDEIIYNARFIDHTTLIGENGYTFSDYLKDIDILFNDCKDYFLSHYETLEEVKLDKPIKINITIIDVDKAKDNIEKDTITLSSKKTLTDELAEKLGVDAFDIKVSFGKKLSDLLNEDLPDDPIIDYKEGKCRQDFKDRIEEIIDRMNHKGRVHANVITAYSGRLNPRLTINNDYKWWNRDYKGENNGLTNKLHLNLFIDVSGSFSFNQEKMNKILAELDNLEKKMHDKFFYKLITMSDDIKIIDDNKRRIRCSGGTSLSKLWINTYRKVQDRKYETINIVLFDGQCYNDDNMDVFSMFNNNNTIIISDDENKYPIEKYCKNAKDVVIVSDNNYLDHLEDNIINTLNKAIR